MGRSFAAAVALVLCCAAPGRADYVITDLGARPGYLVHAFGINDAGQIIGYGEYQGQFFPRAFLLTPAVPEPASVTLAVLGGAVAGAWMARRNRPLARRCGRE